MTAKRRQDRINSFLIACVVALILLPSAVLKWLYPPLRDPLFYEIIGGVEAALALALLIYSRIWRVWVLLALVVSIWMGFSLYTTVFGLPCSCMGGAFELPRGVTLILNALMAAGAWIALKHHPAHPVSFKRLFWFFIVFLIIGFTSAVIYYNYQT